MHISISSIIFRTKSRNHNIQVQCITYQKCGNNVTYVICKNWKSWKIYVPFLMALNLKNKKNFCFTLRSKNFFRFLYKLIDDFSFLSRSCPFCLLEISFYSAIRNRMWKNRKRKFLLSIIFLPILSNIFLRLLCLF